MVWTYWAAYVVVGFVFAFVALRELVCHGQIHVPEDACCCTFLAVLWGALWPIAIPMALAMIAVWTSATKRKEVGG